MSQETPEAPLEVPDKVPVLVVGGPADGIILPTLRADAAWIELSRPSYVKPLAHSDQQVPEIMAEKGRYEVHVLAISDSDTPDDSVWFGIACAHPLQLSACLKRVFIGYTHHVLARLRAAGAVETDPESITH